MAESDHPGRERLRRLAGDEPVAKTHEPGRSSAVAPAQAHAGATVGKRTLAESWGTTLAPSNGPVGVGTTTLAESWGAGALPLERNSLVCSVGLDAARRHLAAVTASQQAGDHAASAEAAHRLRLALQTARDFATDELGATLAELEAAAAPILAAASTRTRDAKTGPGRGLWASGVAVPHASRQQAWMTVAAPIAAQLGVEAAIRVDDAASAHGARGLAHAGVVHLVPTLALEHSDALHVLAHELVHVAQSRLPHIGSLAEAEHEADTLAAALVRGSLPYRPRVGIAASVAAADNGAKEAKRAHETVPDLDRASFQLIAGTFDFWVNRAWYGAAPDKTVDGGTWISPSRNLELFAALQQRGDLSWVEKAELAEAAREIGIDAPGADTAPVFRLRMTVSVFDAFGLGPEAKPEVAQLADGGLDLVIAIPDVHGAPHRDFVLSAAHKQAILVAIESVTHLPVLATQRAKFLTEAFRATLGNGTTHVLLDGAYCHTLFGASYDKWLVRRASGDPTSTMRPVGITDAALTPDEVAFVKAWLARNLSASADAAAPLIDRRFYAALRALEDLPAEQRALVAHLLAVHTRAQPVSASLLEHLLFEADRAHAGFAEHAANPDARPPTFDYPIPARLDQASGRVVDGEAVKLRLLIAWPEAATGDQASDYHWRAEVAEIDWLFVCDAEEGKPRLELRESSRVHGDGTGIEHRFTVPGHLESAVWQVHAFVRHNLFQPKRLYTEIEVRRVDVAMTELRAQAFAGLGQPETVEDEHDFFPDDRFDAGSYDTGRVFRGTLPAEFAHRNAAELAASVDREIAQTVALTLHLTNQHLASAAIAASKAHLAKLLEIKDAIVEVGKKSVRPFELRGTYLGIDNQLADGALDLIGTTWFSGHLDGSLEINVDIFDLSRRFDSKTSTFSGAGATFERAIEAAFLKLCKAYPGGRLAILAENTDPHFQTTGKTIGFELDTDTIGKDVKATVFDPIVNKVVNIGLSAVMIVFPETAPVLMTVLVAFNEAQNVDAALSEYARGNLTPGRKLLHLAQFALDVMPLARQARVFDVGGKLFSVFEHGGVVLLMGIQAQEQIAEIRDTQVAEAAQIYAALVTLQGSTHGSDPRIRVKQAELEARITTIQDATLDVMKATLVDYGTVALPGHLVGPLHEALGRRNVAAMESRGAFIHVDDVAPHYDSERDAIVGDRTQATPPVVDALVRQQTAARAAKPAPEPAVRATPEEQAFLDAAAKTSDRSVQRPDGMDRLTATMPAPEAELEAEPAGEPRAKETTAAAVPGSSFKGRGRPLADHAAEQRAAVHVKAAAHASVEHAHTLVPEILDAERVSSAPGAGADATFDDTYVVHLADPPPLTVRVTSGPLSGTVVAKTIVNATKEGTSYVNAQRIEVKGRYVIQLSDAMNTANIERAVAHELAEIVAERKLAQAQRSAPTDALTPTSRPGAVLSPHDHGRIAEIRVVAKQVEAGVAGAEREMIALVEHLGLRGGEDAARRRALAEPLLGDARAVLERFTAETLDPHVQAGFEDVRAHAARDLDTARQRDEARRAVVQPAPDAGPAPGALVTRERAATLARDAMTARFAKSDAFLAELRARGANGAPIRIEMDLQIGGGAGLAGRDPHALLVDKRGRWQADPSEYIAQTAAQLHGVIDAGLGDPFQFALPNGRVPMTAISFWLDTLAARGPLLDGEVVSVRVDAHGRTLVELAPTAGGGNLVLEVIGKVVVCSGFPPERLPGTPKDMTPEKAIGEIKMQLATLIAAGPTPPAVKLQAEAALAEIASLSGIETRPGARESDLSIARNALDSRGLTALMQDGLGAAYKMAVAGDAWRALQLEHPGKVLLGDAANLSTVNPMATDRWVIGGAGGSSISAAEILLKGNPHAHVTMAGLGLPPGLVENTQFQQILKAHADEQTVRALEALTGTQGTPGDGRFSLVLGVAAGTPTESGGEIRINSPRPAGYEAGPDPLEGGGYITAIGREGQLPPVVAAMLVDARANGMKPVVELLFDADRHYVGYRLSLTRMRSTIRTLDVTGAASRSVPWEHVDRDIRDTEKARFRRASDLDAPPESGNFDAGFVASAIQAARYAVYQAATVARAARLNTEGTQ